MAMFQAFKPSGMEKIARSMGYQGNMQGFQNFLAQDPMKQQQMQQYTNQAIQMARGGVVKMQEGGDARDGTLVGSTMDRMSTGALPPGGVTTVSGTPTSDDQFIDPSLGQVSSNREPLTTETADTTKAETPDKFDMAQYQSKDSALDVEKALKQTEAAQGAIDPNATVEAQIQKESSLQLYKKLKILYRPI